MRQSTSTLLAFAVVLLGTSIAHADQCQLINKSIAARAKAELELHPKFVEYCELCGETTPGAPQVATEVTLHAEPDFGASREVFVNGQSIDLAYTFVEKGGVFRNLAELVHCEAHGVSSVIVPPTTTPPAVELPQAAVEVPPPAPPAPPLPAFAPTTFYISTSVSDPWWFLLAGGTGAITGALATLLIVLAARRRRIDLRPRAVELVDR